ncbi:MAG: PKD domain-containing protein, partial [bacterium]
PFGDSISFAWDIDGDGAYDDASTETVDLTSQQLISDYGYVVGTAKTICLEVTDTFGSTDEACTTLGVYENSPVAVANAVPENAACGQDVTLNGSNSYHNYPLFNIIQYKWDFDDSDGVDWGTPDAEGKIVKHIYAKFGTYTATLQVTDDNDPAKVATDTVQIQVTMGNSSPVADANPDPADGDYIASPGATITLDGTQSYDPDAGCGDEIVSYEWDTDNDGLYGLEDDPDDYTGAIVEGYTNHGWEVDFRYTVHLRVTDSLGATDVDTAFITIEPNTPPVANAGPDQSNVEQDNPGGASIILDGSGSSDDGAIMPLQYTWTYGIPDGVEVSIAYDNENEITLVSTPDDSVEISVTDETITFVHNATNTVLVDTTGGELDVYINGNPASTTTIGDFMFVDGLSDIEVQISALDQTTAVVTDSFSVVTGINPNILLPLGTNTVNLDVYDGTFIDSDNVSIIIVDSTPPTALCNNIIVELDGAGSVTISESDIDGGSWDLSGIASLELSKTSFTCDDVRANTVTLTVTDNNGNSSTCEATVTVEDNVYPVAACQDITIQLDAAGNASITADDLDNGSSDACGIDSLALSKTSFTCADVGANTVMLTVTDNNGNTSTCNATVTVEDNVVPVAVCQDITIQLDAEGNASITTADVDNGSSDACGIDSLELSKTSFTCDDVGANTVMLTVTDNNGNESTCNATVTVEDNVDPVAVCRDITIQLDAEGDASITADDVDNGSSDACGIASLALSQTSFTCDDLGDNTVTLTVTDNNDNMSTCEATVTVQDVTAPNTTITGIAGDQSGIAADEYWLHKPVIVSYEVPDACDSNPAIVATPEYVAVDTDAKTATIPPYAASGEITVTIAATDSSGNSKSNSTTFTLVGGMPDVKITDFATTKQGYFPGEEVSINVTVENVSPFIARNLVLKTTATNPAGAIVNQTNEVLPEAVYETPLSYKYPYILPADAMSGNYVVNAELSTQEGIILDTQSTTFGVGQPKIDNFSLNKISFVQMKVTLNTTIKNYSATDSYDVVRMIKVFDGNGAEVWNESETITLLVGGASTVNPIFDITGWPSGQYTAKMSVTDSATGQLYDSAELDLFITVATINVEIGETTYVPGQQVSITATAENAGSENFEVTATIVVKDCQGNIVHTVADEFTLEKMQNKPFEYPISTTLDLPLDTLLGNYTVTAVLTETGGNILHEDEDVFAVIGRIQFERFSLEAYVFTQEEASTGDGILIGQLQVLNYDSVSHDVTLILSLLDPEGNIVEEKTLNKTINAGKRVNFTGQNFVLPPNPMPGNYVITGTIENEVGMAWDKQEASFEIIPTP